MAAKHRKVPWQRNLRKIPDSITKKVQAFSSDLICVATTRQVGAGNAGDYTHLSFPRGKGEVASTLPIAEMGVYSTRNREGWEVKRTDLPMTTKTFYWESPNFGDASTYGTHFHSQVREVYQREFHEPRLYEIETTVLTTTDSSSVFRIGVDQTFDRTSPDFEFDLFFALNLLQENCGSVDVFPSSATRDDYIKTVTLDWEIFPPGTMDEVVASLTRGKTYSAPELKIVTDRVRVFERLKPQRYIRGSGKFGSYIGAQYADDLVVFENLKYGNALYVLYENWEEVSKRSRIDLLRGTDATFDRVPHTDTWKKTFSAILQREKRRRRI